MASLEELERFPNKVALNFYIALIEAERSLSPEVKRKAMSPDAPANAHIGLVDSLYKTLISVDAKLKRFPLDLSGQQLSNAELSVLTEALSESNSIDRLSLQNCGVTHKGAIAVGRMIKTNKALMSLNLSNNPLKDKGVVFIGKKLRKNTGLIDVQLISVGAGDDGIIECVNFLKENKTLTKLDLSSNNLTEDGVSQLIDTLKEDHLVPELILNDITSINDELKSKLARIFSRNRCCFGIFDDCLKSACTQRLLNKRVAQTIGTTASPNICENIEEQEEMPVRGRPRGRTMDNSLIPVNMRSRGDTIRQEQVGTTSKRFKIGVAEMVGRRPDMQDVSLIRGAFRGNEDEDLFAVFDGHGSQKAAAFAASNFPDILGRHLLTKDPATSLRKTFLDINDQLKTTAIHYGTTAAVALIMKSTLYVANVGDTRVVIKRDGKGVRLTVDHNLDLPGEAERVKQMGGFIENNRVQGQLQVTRALGDWSLQPYVSADPYITVTELDENDRVILLGCDGLFDIFVDDLAIDIANSIPDPQKASERLRDQAYLSGSTDNISVVVARLNEPIKRTTDNITPNSTAAAAAAPVTPVQTPPIANISEPSEPSTIDAPVDPNKVSESKSRHRKSEKSLKDSSSSSRRLHRSQTDKLDTSSSPGESRRSRTHDKDKDGKKKRKRSSSSERRKKSSKESDSTTATPDSTASNDEESRLRRTSSADRIRYIKPDPTVIQEAKEKSHRRKSRIKLADESQTNSDKKEESTSSSKSSKKKSEDNLVGSQEDGKKEESTKPKEETPTKKKKDKSAEESASPEDKKKTKKEKKEESLDKSAEESKSKKKSSSGGKKDTKSSDKTHD